VLNDPDQHLTVGVPDKRGGSAHGALVTGAVPQPTDSAAAVLDVDLCAHENRAVVGEAEVFGGAGGVAGEGEEQSLAPAVHAWCVGASDGDAREKVGGVVEVKLKLGVVGAGEEERFGEVWQVLEAEAGTEMDDGVVGVAEVVEAECLGRWDVGDVFGLR
jgi:hypothetical protein